MTTELDQEQDRVEILASYQRTRILFVRLYRSPESGFFFLDVRYGTVEGKRSFVQSNDAWRAFRSAVETDLFDVVRE